MCWETGRSGPIQPQTGFPRSLYSRRLLRFRPIHVAQHSAPHSRGQAHRGGPASGAADAYPVTHCGLRGAHHSREVEAGPHRAGTIRWRWRTSIALRRSAGVAGLPGETNGPIGRRYQLVPGNHANLMHGPGVENLKTCPRLGALAAFELTRQHRRRSVSSRPACSSLRPRAADSSPPSANPCPAGSGLPGRTAPPAWCSGESTGACGTHANHISHAPGGFRGLRKLCVLGRASAQLLHPDFGGLQDHRVTGGDPEAWRDQATAAFSLRMFPGDRFFLNKAEPLLLQAVPTNKAETGKNPPNEGPHQG